MIPSVLDNASPESAALYRHLLKALRPLGAFNEDVKKTSIHLSRKSAFLGVHFRRNHLLITIKSERPIVSPRIVKTEQVSKSRWHCECKVSEPNEVDEQLLGWAAAAYELCT